MAVKSEGIPDYPLRSIYFYPTESCNLRCIHCWIQPAYAPDDASYQKQNQNNVSVETMERVIKDALPLGLNHIKLTGGEPFLNPGLFEYLDCFVRNGLSLGFETNGTLLTEAIVKRLKDYNIRQISVSLDGSTQEGHERIRGVKDCFKWALAGINLLIENGIYPQVIFCLQKMNAPDLESTIQLAHELRVKSFKINPLTLIGYKALKSKPCEGLSIAELLRLEKTVEHDLAIRYPDMHIDLYLPPALKGIKEVSRHPLCTCRILNICGILSNGDVSICGIGRRMKELIVGNVKDMSIAQIWEEGTVFKEIRQKVPFQMNGICERCLFKFHCLGFCRADVLASKRSLTAPYDVCQEVFERGLFPESRILRETEAAMLQG